MNFLTGIYDVVLHVQVYLAILQELTATYSINQIEWWNNW